MDNKELEFLPIGLMKSEDYHIFRAETVKKQNPKGEESNFVELKSPNWVSAIVRDKAVYNFKSHTVEDVYYLVSQYRHGINKVATELPCGMVEKGEDPISAIARECKEEIGLTNITKIEKLYTHNANPAFLNNNMSAYYIEGCIDEKLLNPDDNEFIRIERFSEPEVNCVMSNPDTNVMMRLAWEIYKNKILNRN